MRDAEERYQPRIGHTHKHTTAAASHGLPCVQITKITILRWPFSYASFQYTEIFLCPVFWCKANENVKNIFRRSFRWFREFERYSVRFRCSLFAYLLHLKIQRWNFTYAQRHDANFFYCAFFFSFLFSSRLYGAIVIKSSFDVVVVRTRKLNSISLNRRAPYGIHHSTRFQTSFITDYEFSI